MRNAGKRHYTDNNYNGGLGVEGEWEGIGHCVVGTIDGEAPQPAPRRDGRVFWAE